MTSGHARRRPPGRPEIAVRLETICRLFHQRALVHPDPLEFLYRYPEIRDRELVALVASGLAYGRVAGILSSVQRVLDAMGPHPARTLAALDRRQLARRLRGFRHRWTSEEDVLQLLRASAEAQRSWGLLGERLADQVEAGAPDIQAALEKWARQLRAFGLPERHSLLPDPGRGSAAKRLHLMLRWMVRQDEIDPGGWTRIPRALLLAPLDVHMHRIGRALGFTRRRAADLRTAREVTAGFRRYDPADPVRFDFALTRMPIHFKMSPAALRRFLREGGEIDPQLLDDHAPFR